MKKKPILLVFILFLLFLAPSVMAVEPIGIVVEKAEGEPATCKYCGRLIKVGPIHSDAVTVIENKLIEKVNEYKIPFTEEKEAKRYLNLYLYRYEERKGGNYAVDKPSSIGFHMHLMEGTTVGRTYVFDEAQQPLLQNVLEVGKFVKRGGKWVTAERLAGEGVDKGLKSMLDVLKEPTEEVKPDEGAFRHGSD
jgi:hypothetical protein